MRAAERDWRADTRSTFWLYLLDGTYQSVIAYYIPHLMLMNGVTMSVTGRDTSLAAFGTTIAVGALLAANLFVGLNTFAWTWMVYVAVIGSSAAVWLWIAIYSAYPGTTFTGTLVAIFTTAECWLVIILVQVLCLGPRFVWK